VSGVSVEGEGEIDELVRRYEHRVPFFTRQIQQRFMLGSRWRDELVSAGYWGLFKALRNRRADAHPRELSAYVSRRIQGAVIDEARLCLAHSTRASGAVDGDELHGLEARQAGFGPRGVWSSKGALPHDERGPEEVAALRWRQSAIDSALSGLDASDKAILRAYMAGDTLREIALENGVSEGTMQVRFQRVVRRVRARAPRLRRILLDQDYL